jgi:hypothetical protein
MGWESGIQDSGSKIRDPENPYPRYQGPKKHRNADIDDATVIH